MILFHSHSHKSTGSNTSAQRKNTVPSIMNAAMYTNSDIHSGIDGSSSAKNAIKNANPNPQTAQIVR